MEIKTITKSKLRIMDISLRLFVFGAWLLYALVTIWTIINLFK